MPSWLSTISGHSAPLTVDGIVHSKPGLTFAVNGETFDANDSRMRFLFLVNPDSRLNCTDGWLERYVCGRGGLDSLVTVLKYRIVRTVSDDWLTSATKIIIMGLMDRIIEKSQKQTKD